MSHHISPMSHHISKCVHTVLNCNMLNRCQLLYDLLYQLWRKYYWRGPPLYSPACAGGLYLIKFFFGNLSYTPCTDPSRTVLLLDVMYTMHSHHPS